MRHCWRICHDWMNKPWQSAPLKQTRFWRSGGKRPCSKSKWHQSRASRKLTKPWHTRKENSRYCTKNTSDANMSNSWKSLYLKKILTTAPSTILHLTTCCYCGDSKVLIYFSGFLHWRPPGVRYKISLKNYYFFVLFYCLQKSLPYGRLIARRRHNFTDLGYLNQLQ